MKKKLDLGKEPGWIKKRSEDKKANKIKVALMGLDVDIPRLEREPKIMEMLGHRSLGGLKQVMEAMRMSRDPVIVKFLERWDRVSPHFQKVIPWEAVAQKVEIDTRQLLGAIMIALREHSANEVKIAALTAHPEITRATVTSAMIPGNEGYRDRQLIHTALGFLAPPKGQTINVNLPGVLDFNEAREGEMIKAEDIDMNEMFPDLIQTQRKLIPE